VEKNWFYENIQKWPLSQGQIDAEIHFLIVPSDALLALKPSVVFFVIFAILANFFGIFQKECAA